MSGKLLPHPGGMSISPIAINSTNHLARKLENSFARIEYDCTGFSNPNIHRCSKSTRVECGGINSNHGRPPIGKPCRWRIGCDSSCPMVGWKCHPCHRNSSSRQGGIDGTEQFYCRASNTEWVLIACPLRVDSGLSDYRNSTSANFRIWL